MAIDLTRLIPGYGLFRHCYEGSEDRLKSYQHRPNSNRSKEIKDIVREILIKTYNSNNSDVRWVTENMTFKAPNAVIHLKPRERMTAQDKEDDIRELVDKGFKIVDALSGEGDSFAIAAPGMESPDMKFIKNHASYVIGINPSVQGDRLRELVIREVCYSMYNGYAIQEFYRGLASCIASVAACYFGCPLLSPPAALVADGVIAPVASNYMEEYLKNCARECRLGQPERQ